MAIDHDQIFKTLLKSFFREFMELFLPKEAKAIDFSQTDFLDQEVFTDLPKGLRKRLDLVVKAVMKNGQEEYVLIHTELQARRDPHFPDRMFEYYAQLYLRYRKPIIPVVLFTDDSIWKKPIPDKFEIKVNDRRYVQFNYHLIKLKHLDYRQYLATKNPLAYALMAKMNYNKTERARLKADFLRLILGAPINPARQSLLLKFVDTYLSLDSTEESEFNKLIVDEKTYSEVNIMITTWEQRGIEKGSRETMQNALALLLEKKFGPLEESRMNKIRRIRSMKRLDSLILATLDVESIEELDI